jgi:serine/threonine-protein kinase
MSQPSWIGQTIGGRYKIEALLGQGGMSAVYRGSDPNLRRTVAVKLIHPHLSSDPDFVRRFEQEAAAVAQLRHPNIIQVYDFNRDGDVFYMVLEYLPGETLQTKLKALHAAGQRLPIGEAVRIMAVVCDAVAYAHGRGMIHRDLKPANVMLNPEGQPILMDFGVAKMRGGEQHTATGAIIGTVTYMSPEQARGDRLDERADLYSLGVMLFEMIAGRPPFEGDSIMTVMLKHMNEPPPDLRPLNKDAPEGLAAIIQKALAKNPGDRFQTASEMAAALRGATTLVPTVVQQPSTAATQAGAPSTQVVAPPAQSTLAGQQPQTAATAIGAQRKRGPLPLAMIAGGVGALALCAVIAVVIVLPQLAPGKPTPTERAATVTSAIVAEVSPTPKPKATATSVPATDTALPSSETPAPPTDTPLPTDTPTDTPVPVPAGMILVPAGTFNMGSDEGEADEKPVHQVTLKAFFIDQFEVTNARYKKCVDEGQCDPPVITGSFTRAAYFGNSEFDNFPVVKVTWRQATAFCAWEGKRLPTEAEWEYAASGGDGRRYSWGNDFDASRVPAAANDTVEVGALDNASPFGVSDMAGNVVEWVSDRYGAYSADPAENPTGPAAGSQQVMRGGSFGNADGRFYTTTRRYHQGPGFHDVDIGFRCAADAP